MKGLIAAVKGMQLLHRSCYHALGRVKAGWQGLQHEPGGHAGGRRGVTEVHCGANVETLSAAKSAPWGGRPPGCGTR